MQPARSSSPRRCHSATAAIPATRYAPATTSRERTQAQYDDVAREAEREGGGGGWGGRVVRRGHITNAWCPASPGHHALIVINARAAPAISGVPRPGWCSLVGGLLTVGGAAEGRSGEKLSQQMRFLKTTAEAPWCTSPRANHTGQRVWLNTIGRCRALIAGTLQAASTSAIRSDRSSWLRLPPLMPPAAASMRCFGPDLVSSAPTTEHGGLQVLLPRRTHRFFSPFGVRAQRSFRVAVWLWEERSGLKTGRTLL